MDTSKFWDYDGQITLPHLIRTYIDSLADEFKDITIDQKLLEMAYAFLYGYDMKKVVRNKLKDNQYIDDSTVNSTIATYIQYLRTSKEERSGLSFQLLGNIDDYTIKTLYANIDLLKEELILRIRLTRDGQPYLLDCHWDEDAILFDESMSIEEKRKIFKKSTPISMFTFTENDILRENPWAIGLNNGRVNYVMAIADRLYSPIAHWLLNIDQAIVDAYNKANEKTDEEINLKIPPEPFYGNPLKAKVIILSLNPGYVDRANRLIPIALKIQMEEEVNKHKHDLLNLGAQSFFCARYPNAKDQLSYRDAECMIGDWYWYDIFERMRNESDGQLPPEDDYQDVIYDNIALVQYMGYFSKSYKGFSRNMILPSQRFTQHQLWYIIFNKPDVLIVVSRSEKEWHSLLGDDAWQKLMVENRLVVRNKFGKNGKRKPFTRQDFTKNAFENNGFERIIKAIKSCKAE